jgi:hypothetical protein
LQQVVDEYAQAMRDGDKFPPVILFGRILADGFYRLAAASQCGLPNIDSEVREGDQRSALLFAATSNVTHGVRRKPVDIRNQVRTLLLDEEWRQWSNGEIARKVGVAANTVRYQYRKMVTDHEIPERGDKVKVSRGGTEYEQTWKQEPILANGDDGGTSTPEKPRTKKKPKSQDEIHWQFVVDALSEWELMPHDGAEAYRRWGDDRLAERLEKHIEWCQEYIESAGREE